MPGLEGVRVLELGHMVSAAYAAKLLADLGADVIKIEEHQGDRARQRGPFPGGTPHAEKSGLFLALNTNKRGVTLNLQQSQGQAQLHDLVSSADILIHNYPPSHIAALGINYETFRQMNPRLVMCSITPFGLTGPHRQYHAYEITLAHGGGWAWLSPGASDRPDLPPLKAFGHQADFQGALAASVVTLGAYYRALNTGMGEHIDLSEQEFVASFLEQNFVYYSYMGKVASRLGQRLIYPWGIFQCQDGLIFLINVEQDQWSRLIDLMGNPEWASWEIFKDQFARAENWDVIKPYLDEWMQQWKVEELWRAGQERRICFSPVFTMPQLATQEQLRARNFFIEVTHPQAGTLTHLGAPYRLGESWLKIRRPAPLLGEHNTAVFDTHADTQHATRKCNPQSQSLAPSTQHLAPVCPLKAFASLTSVGPGPGRSALCISPILALR